MISSNQVYSNDTTPYKVAGVVYDITSAGGGSPILASGAAPTAVINTLSVDGNLISITPAAPGGGAIALGPGTQAVTTTNAATLTNKTLTNPIITPPSSASSGTSLPLGVSLFGAISRLNDIPIVHRWTLGTIGATTDQVLFDVPTGRPVTLYHAVSGTVASGPLLNNILTRVTYSAVSTLSGIATFKADFGPVVYDQIVGTAAASITTTCAALTAGPLVTGVAGNTIVWYGETHIVPIN